MISYVSQNHSRLQRGVMNVGDNIVNDRLEQMCYSCIGVYRLEERDRMQCIDEIIFSSIFLGDIYVKISN